MYSKLQACARKILAKEKVLKDVAKNADEAKQIDEIIEELKKTANISELSKVEGRERSQYEYENYLLA